MMEDCIEVILQDRTSRVYGLWAMFCMPGLRVSFRLKVPFLPSTKEQTQNVIKLVDGRKARLADLGSGDGRLDFNAQTLKINLWSILSDRTSGRWGFWKLIKELPEDARLIVCRFPFSPAPQLHRRIWIKPGLGL